MPAGGKLPKDALLHHMFLLKRVYRGHDVKAVFRIDDHKIDSISTMLDYFSIKCRHFTAILRLNHFVDPKK